MKLLSLVMLMTSAISAVEPKILYEQDAALLTSTIEVVVTTGTSDDPPGKNGVVSLACELLLRGTKTKSRSVFQSEVERLGAALDVRSSHDSIFFVGKVIRENTIPFLKLIQEALLKPAMLKSEFESLKTEVLAEIAHTKNNNGRLSGLALRREMFQGTIMEKPGSGTLSTVKSIQLSDVVRVYNSFFNRGNLFFAMASSLPLDEVKPILTETWLKLPDGARRQRRSITQTAIKKTTLILVHKANTSTGSVIFGQPGITAQDPLRYVLNTANFAFGGEPLVSRLFRIVRGELGWTYYVGSSYNAMGSLSHQKGFFVVSATPSVEHTSSTIFKILSMWKEYYETGLKPEELSLASESLVNSYPFEFESAEKRLSQQLYSYLYGVPVLDPVTYGKTINAIGFNDIKKALRESHDPDAWLITLVADKTVVEKQLADAQKDVPPAKRLVISKVYSPDDLVN